MKKATLTIGELAFDLYFDGEKYFTIESFTRVESFQFPLLDENGDQVFNYISETENAPVFYFENKTICRPYKSFIAPNDEMKADFDKLSWLVEEKHIEKYLEPYFVD